MICPRCKGTGKDPGGNFTATENRQSFSPPNTCYLCNGDRTITFVCAECGEGMGSAPVHLKDGRVVCARCAWTNNFPTDEELI